MKNPVYLFNQWIVRLNRLTRKKQKKRLRVTAAAALYEHEL